MNIFNVVVNRKSSKYLKLLMMFLMLTVMIKLISMFLGGGCAEGHGQEARPGACAGLNVELLRGAAQELQRALEAFRDPYEQREKVARRLERLADLLHRPENPRALPPGTGPARGRGRGRGRVAAERSAREWVTALVLRPGRRGGEAPDAALAGLRDAERPRVLALVAQGHAHRAPLHKDTNVLERNPADLVFPGKILNWASGAVDTKFVLFVRDAHHINEQANVAGLVGVARAVARRGARAAAVVGGAARDERGRWSAGCALLRLEPYALRVRAGYARALAGCMRCDALRGPFLAPAHLVRDIPFSESLPVEVVFLDWFLRLHKSKAVVLSCADSMFFVERTPEERTEADTGEDRNASTPIPAWGARGRRRRRRWRGAWRLLAAAWGFDTLHLPGAPPLRFACHEVGLVCAGGERRHLAQCCAAQTLPPLRALDRFAARRRLRYEMADDLALYAATARALPLHHPSQALLKVDGAGPWEQWNREMDLGSFVEYLDRNATGRTCSFLHVGALRVALRCEDAAALRADRLPTRANVQGAWLALPPNPGAYLRLRFGPDFVRAALAPACRAAAAAAAPALDPDQRRQHLQPEDVARASRCPPAL